MAKKKVLLSFVGFNDAGKLVGKKNGAILTAVKNEKFNEVILLWNDSKIEDITFEYILKHVKSELLKQRIIVKDYLLTFNDVTDHNEIYNVIKKFTDTLPKTSNIKYSAAISSGTPSMQVCWILLAESGDFSEIYPLRLIKIKDPKFGKSENIEVKLDSTLPKIIRLKNELENLKKDLIPTAVVETKRGLIKIGKYDVDLSPIEFCYYRYFAERVLKNVGDEKFAGFSVSLKFMEEILNYHKESFPDLELNRLDLQNMLNKQNELGIQTFRGNISKVNKKIKNTLRNETLTKYFSISIEGKRGAKFYGIKASKAKIKIVK